MRAILASHMRLIMLANFLHPAFLTSLLPIAFGPLRIAFRSLDRERIL
jgi:hypothetical protein